ncbi:MAG TPA: hypothetical protein VL970_00225 [Candidatus Acidoferrales bacterium]|nr:hypothetical protein [Candidatus Acidoferrales bacterium]
MNLPWTFLLALTLLAGSMPCGYGSSVHPNSARNGFVPLSQWAKENDFKPTWIKQDDTVARSNELKFQEIHLHPA